MGSPVTARIPRVPVAAVVAAGLVIGVSVVLMFAGGLATGVSWDEPYRVGKLNNFLTSGWFVDDLQDGQPLDFNAYVYAPVADLYAHAIGVLAGAQEWSQAAVTAQAYAARHVAIGVLAITGLAAVTAIGGLLLSSWRWGVVAAALLSSVPLWAGHGMFNSSDMPVASGYTVATLAVVVLARAAAAGGSWPASLAGGCLLALGTILSLGTRPATWPALVVTSAIALAAAPIVAPLGRRRSALFRTGTAVVAALAAAYAVLLAVYPKAFGNPLVALRESVTQSAQFGATGSEPAPARSLLEAAGYLPSWLALQLPIVVGLLLLIGLATVVGVVLRSRVLGPDVPWRAAGLLAVTAQLLVLPVGAAVLRSNVYDGIRQFLFILPSAAVLCAVGLATVLALAQRLSRGGVVTKTAIWVVVALGLALPMVDQARLFPYGYAYVNELSAREQIDGRLPTDYWRTSMRELIPLVPAEGATSCTFDPLILGLVPIDCAAQGQLLPFWATRGTAGTKALVPAGKYLYLESNRGRVDPGPGCTVLDRVTRTLHGQEVTMSYVALCDAPCVVQESAQCAGKDLSGANLDGWNLRNSDFAGATLVGTSLVLADLTGANLTGADLTGAVLASTNLTGANLTGANLTGANLTGANLTGADLTGVIGLTDQDA